MPEQATFAARAETNPLVADFDRVVREHQRRIYRVLFGILRDTDAADTLAQECFLRAWKQRVRFRGESSVGTWLTRIAVNLAIDHQRSRRQSFWKRLFAAQERDEEAANERMAAVADGAASPERQLLAREQAGRVWEIVGALPVQQRTIFVLRFAEELPLEEIAEAMNLQVGTVKAHLFRAVHTVRTKWKKM
jgi:RNA polymerase sigma-70 factor, ECF subfamily